MSDEWITAPGYGYEGFETAAGFSTIGWRQRGRSAKKCKGANDTCGAYKVKGEDFCAGHLRAERKKRGDA